MTVVEIEADKPQFPVFIDSTMLTTFRSCRMKFYYNFIRHLRPPGKSIHLVAGGAFAAGVDAARRVAYTTPNCDYSTMLEAAAQAFLAEWGDYIAPEGHAKSLHNTFYALERYLHEHPPLTDSIQPVTKSDNTPAVEFSFAIPLDIKHPATGDPIVFCGRFDMLGMWNDLFTIVDEKTTSALGPTWLDQWKLRGQFLGYCWACQQLGYPVRQVAIRGIGILKTDIKFLTALELYPQYLIDRWVVEAHRTIEEMIHCFQNNYWTHNFGDACSSYGGCTYKELCIAADPEQWVSNFEVRVWNPVLREELVPA